MKIGGWVAREGKLAWRADQEEWSTEKLSFRADGGQGVLVCRDYRAWRAHGEQDGARTTGVEEDGWNYGSAYLQSAKKSGGEAGKVGVSS